MVVDQLDDLMVTESLRQRCTDFIQQVTKLYFPYFASQTFDCFIMALALMA